MEERLPVLYSEGVAKGRLSICELVRLLCANPSRLYGLYPRKGTLQPGADADVVILDPAKRRTLTHAGLHSAVDYTCYEGMELQGAIDLVLSRGEVAAPAKLAALLRGCGPGVWDTRQRSHFSMRARSWSANRPRSLLVPPLLWAMTSMSLRPTSSRRW